jgi:hypothetical protein
MVEFRDNGTITVEIGGTTYTLRRPTMGQLWHFFDLRDDLAKDAQAKIKTLADELAEVGEDSKKGKTLVASLSDRRFVFRFMAEPWLREAFETLGSKPLPENLDDAPAELADPSLPQQILLFWRSVPLARGPKGQG